MKKTKSSKDRADCSNCFICGWRWPTNSNDPKMCLLGIRNGDHGERLSNFPHCDRYIRDDILKSHFEKLLRLDEAFKNEIVENFKDGFGVTIIIRQEDVGDMVDYMINRGKTKNEIRRCFGLREA